MKPNGTSIAAAAPPATLSRPVAAPAFTIRPELWAIVPLIAALNLHLVFPGAVPPLHFRADLVAAGEWWRIFTHPFVHASGWHLFLDGAAFLLLLAGLQESSLLRRLALTASSAAGALVAAALFHEATAVVGYAGLSGAAHGLMAVSALELALGRAGAGLRKAGVLLFAIVVVKSGIEAWTGECVFDFIHMGRMGVPVAVSHAGGLVGGLLAFIAVRLGAPRPSCRKFSRGHPGDGAGWMAGTRCFRTGLSLLAVAFLTGCGRWPPVVRGAADLDQLPPDTTSIRARSLADSDIPALRRFRGLRFLDFYGGHAVKQARLTDEGLRNLSALELPSLHTLHVGPNKNITDTGLEHVAKLRSVNYLGLALCDRITDAGIETVATMTYLDGLDLRGNTSLTDKGLIHLGSMQNLKSLVLDGCTNISAAAVQELRLSLPGCKVRKDDASWDYQMRHTR